MHRIKTESYIGMSIKSTDVLPLLILENAKHWRTSGMNFV